MHLICGTRRFRKFIYLFLSCISICMFLLIGISHLVYSAYQQTGLRKETKENNQPVELEGIKGKLTEGN